jgi:hypothetical protein
MEGHMRSIYFLAGAAALALAACDGAARTTHTSKTTVSDDDGRAYQINARLDCPEREGDLERVSAAADGRSCLYRSERGGEAELRLVDLNGGDGEAYLKTLEQQLKPLGPVVADAPAPPEPPEAAAAERSSRESSHVRIPGLLDVQTDGDKATVRLPGVTVNASDDDSADVRVGHGDQQVTVHARDEAAEVRAHDNKRGRLSSMYLLAADTPSAAGWRVVGYVARGSKQGPLVVGTAKVREDRDDAFEDMEDLVGRNAKKR